MFSSLKSKIKEETGSDISKLTSSWRNGAFLGRITLRDDSVSLDYLLFINLLYRQIKTLYFIYLFITKTELLVNYLFAIPFV